MSGASDRVSRMPRRISAWSSQRKTLIIGGQAWTAGAAPGSDVAPLTRIVRPAVRFRLGRHLGEVERNRQDQAGALRTAAEVDPAADRAGPLVQSADAERTRLCEVFLAQPAAVVADLEREHAAG